jgi:hypothetical protein
MDERTPAERRLDALIRPALVVDPPAEVQQSILATVLAVAPALIVASASVAALRPRPVAVPAAAGRPVSLVAYLLLGAALLAYVGVVSWLQGVVGGSDWLGTMARQVLAAVDLALGGAVSTDPLTLLSTLWQAAPWLAVLPVAVYLWERDRAPSRTT